MSDLKTRPTGDSVEAFLNSVEDDRTLYIMAGFDEYDDLLERLGKHKTGKSCLYLNRLDDVDLQVLRQLVRRSAEHIAESNA